MTGEDNTSSTSWCITTNTPRATNKHACAHPDEVTVTCTPLTDAHTHTMRKNPQSANLLLVIRSSCVSSTLPWWRWWWTSDKMSRLQSPHPAVSVATKTLDCHTKLLTMSQLFVLFWYASCCFVLVCFVVFSLHTRYVLHLRVLVISLEKHGRCNQCLLTDAIFTAPLGSITTAASVSSTPKVMLPRWRTPEMTVNMSCCSCIKKLQKSEN